MLSTYARESGRLQHHIEDLSAVNGALWVDLMNPSDAEREFVGKALEVELPTRADMEEIETSSRLYQEGNAIFMTALVLANSDSEHPKADVITFVLVRDKLVTIRFVDPQSFRTFQTRCDRGTVRAERGETMLMALLDVIIDRMADILEKVGGEIEAISHDIFDPAKVGQASAHDFQDVLRKLGRRNDLNGKMRESLLTLSRVLSFLTPAMESRPSNGIGGHIQTLTRDIQSLQDHTSYLSGKLSYLLDATLGLINIEQNNIIKIMSVAAMVFLPPTLIASVEGMNFKAMPELDWAWGYPFSLVLMLFSAIIPYLWFKRRGWL
jgi:magnesium transporter